MSDLKPESLRSVPKASWLGYGGMEFDSSSLVEPLCHAPIVKWRPLSHVWLFETPWTIQAMEFSRPELLEWVSFPFSRGSSQPRNQTGVSCIAGWFSTNWAIREAQSYMRTMKVKSLSRVRLCATPWTVARQAPPSMGFSRQEYWSGLPFPSPGDLPKPGDVTQVSRIAGRRFNLWATREALHCFSVILPVPWWSQKLSSPFLLFFLSLSLSFITSLLSSQNWSVFIIITSNPHLIFFSIFSKVRCFLGCLVKC